MDKTTVFEATFHPNKRKPTDSTKYTDNFLSDEIHANLRAMSFLVPFGAELDALFAHVSRGGCLQNLLSTNNWILIPLNLLLWCYWNQGMFMKSNAKAFPHVTRYLLLIYDAIEFRKKFRWPIFDKAGEALFRWENWSKRKKKLRKIKNRIKFEKLKKKLEKFPFKLQ